MAMAMVGRVDVDKCEKAAECGQTQAQFDLAPRYATGSGVERDYVIAHKWFNLAAVQGNFEAREHRTDLARGMEAAEVARAQRLAREWMLAH